MQNLPNVSNSRENVFFYRKLYHTIERENKKIFSIHNYFKEQIYILLEALIVFLNPPEENLTNCLSN